MVQLVEGDEDQACLKEAYKMSVAREGGDLLCLDEASEEAFPWGWPPPFQVEALEDGH